MDSVDSPTTSLTTAVDPIAARRAPDIRWLIAGLSFVVFLRLGLFKWSLGYLVDFDQLYYAAAHLLHGVNPYPIATQSWPWPLLYPMPAVLLAVPFTVLPLEVARQAFDVLVGSAFAFALWRYRGPYALFALVSGSYLFAMRYGQTTPLMVAAALVPALGFLLTVKPNDGLVLWLAQPNRKAVIGGVAVLLLSLAVLPSWPLDWLGALRQQSATLLPPVVRPFGFVLLLSILRWRTAEGRLLLALALIPQNVFPHELVPLALIPSSLVEMGIYVAGTWVALAVTASVMNQGLGLPLTVARIWPVILVAVYLPMLWLVLRRRRPEKTDAGPRGSSEPCAPPYDTPPRCGCPG